MNTERLNYLREKRMKILEEIKPICEVFGIKDYDYEIQTTTLSESLIVDGTKIACNSNSISAVIDELIGYIFINRWCRNRSLGHFETQTKNVIMQHWIN